MACGGSIMIYNNQIYRSFDGGIAPLDENLNIQVHVLQMKMYSLLLYQLLVQYNPYVFDILIPGF